MGTRVPSMQGVPHMRSGSMEMMEDRRSLAGTSSVSLLGEAIFRSSVMAEGICLSNLGYRRMRLLYHEGEAKHRT